MIQNKTPIGKLTTLRIRTFLCVRIYNAFTTHVQRDYNANTTQLK